MTATQTGAICRLIFIVSPILCGLGLLVAFGPKPAPQCHLTLPDTIEARKCERECVLATYAAEFRTERLGSCLQSVCGATIAPNECRNAYQAGHEPLEYQ